MDLTARQDAGEFSINDKVSQVLCTAKTWAGFLLRMNGKGAVMALVMKLTALVLAYVRIPVGLAVARSKLDKHLTLPVAPDSEEQRQFIAVADRHRKKLILGHFLFIISFIDRPEVINKILQYLGL